MPNEINITTQLNVRNGFLSLNRSNAVQADMTGLAYTAQGQTIGTSYEALDVGTDVVVGGYVHARNVDATNFVEIGLEVAAAFHPLIKLLPGEVAIFRAATLSLFARANTAAVKLDFTILDS